MLTVLVVGRHASEVGATEPGSALEILYAGDAEEAVEKLARNRRIDAVLILGSGDARASVEAIAEDVTAPPPIFLAQDAAPVASAMVLPSRRLEDLLARVVEALEG